MVDTNGLAVASAVTTEPLVDVTALFGADGAAAADLTQYALSFTSTATGLTVTDGDAILLVDVMATAR